MSRAVHLVVPGGWSDPLQPSGGNRYDERLRAGLEACGWLVLVHELPGSWPRPTTDDLAAMAGVLAGLPARSMVLVDGLVGSPSAAALVPETGRLRVVPLVHLPLGDAEADPVWPDLAASEQGLLAAASAVLTTSEWTRQRLLERYEVPPANVHVAEPGTDPAPMTTPGRTGGRLSSVAAVVAHKGHDTLLHALGRLLDLDWHADLVGPLDRDPALVASLRDRIARAGLAGRVSFRGPLAEPELRLVYAATDLLVVPSRAESYGLTVTEALARGIPLVANDVGGIPEAVGTTSDGQRPGLLLPVDDVDAWTEALRRWLEDADLRSLLRVRAVERRSSLPTWDTTARRVSSVLERTLG